MHQDKRLKAGQCVAFGYRLVESLNIGTIAGLCTAVAIYFWANRLLPVDFAGRRDWEVHAMFILWTAAVAYDLLPVLNALTTERHLGVPLSQGDGALAMLGCLPSARARCGARRWPRSHRAHGTRRRNHLFLSRTSACAPPRPRARPAQP